jgi:uncharacterized protein (TIGR02594 family)
MMTEDKCEERMSVETVPRHLHPYEWAKREWAANIKELPGKEQNNPRILWYHSLTTLRATDDETPWCSAFMCAAAFMAALKSTRSAAAKSWEGYGLEVKPEDAQVGDIVVLKRSAGGNPNARHVAFLDAPYRVGDKLVQLLGGNQGNAVSKAKFKAEDIVAIRRFSV